MPLFFIERSFAEQPEVNRHRSALTRVNTDISIQ
jgi:hypothetical protein